MFQRILLCYDGSPESRRALLRGGKLAVTLKAQAIVLSIVPAGISDPSMTACLAGSLCVADDSDRFQRYLDEAVNWLITRGIDAEGVLTTGDFVEQILHHQRLFKIDLIVVDSDPVHVSCAFRQPVPSASLTLTFPGAVIFASPLSVFTGTNPVEIQVGGSRGPVPSGDQLTAARKNVKDQWDSIVGLDIQKAP